MTTRLQRDSSARRSRSPRRGRRRWSLLIAIFLLLACSFYLGGGWYFADQLNHKALDPAVKRSALPNYAIDVVRVGAAEVTLRVPADPGQLLTPGTWGIQWPGGGYAQITAIRSKGTGTVTRAFRPMTGPALVAGTAVAMDNKAFPDNPRIGLGLYFEDVKYGGPLGSYPAWFIPGRTDTWAILVHGNSMDRLDTIKIVPVLHEAGLSVLMIAYRNDAGAPADASGKLRYGATEWEDLAAAVRYAQAGGAQGLMLVGYSTGGAIVTSFLERSSLASSVSAVILDSPMLDFGRTVDYGGSLDRLPSWVCRCRSR